MNDATPALVGLTFPVIQGGTPMSLRELLTLLGPSIDNLRWSASHDLEFVGTADSLHLLLDSRCSTTELLLALADDLQMIEGDLYAHSSDCTPVMTIRSVRGDRWDLFSTSTDALEVLTQSLTGAHRIPAL